MSEEGTPVEGQGEGQVEGQGMEGGGEGLLSQSGGQTQERMYAGKYKTVEDLEKSYAELQKRFSSGEHKQEAAPVNQTQKAAPNAATEEQIAEYDRLRKENMQYKQEQRRSDINAKLGLDYDTEQWKKVADFAIKTKNPKQIAAIEASIEAGMYGSVKDLIEEYNNQSQEQGEETPVPSSPTSSNEGGTNGFASAEEAKKFLASTRNLSKAGSGEEWMRRLLASSPRVREALGAASNNSHPSFG